MIHDLLAGINSGFAERASKRATGLENKLKAAMAAVREDDFMGAGEESLLKAACMGVLLDVGMSSVDGQVVVRSYRHLGRLSAFMAAACAGLSPDPQALEADGKDVLPLLGWWMESKS